ncbi:hypothetical protein ED92_11045 [Amycolatopsis sp. MJM2582]|uniref:hypothetical protein n=1 Tax=Amycolatopsis sp. MJM2582 TaxID=1427749 RepID=UPI00050494A8|nr:hypothetical protein [Amycolatopsis sp. MJM2582]KFZ80849.1 hypothetical protein ED92_11045 [Amycolatopsis sp. MJM2582]
MLEQAAELADLLAVAGVFIPSPAGPPGVDAVTLIRAFIVDSSGEDLAPLTTHQAEDLHDTLAAAGLFGDGTFTPLPLTGQRDDRPQSP